LNEEESECSIINVNINVSDIFVKKAANRRKPMQSLESRIIYPVYEPCAIHNKSVNDSDKNNNNNHDIEDDNSPIVNYMHYSKISKLARKIEGQ
jgi:hypothetical protein